MVDDDRDICDVVSDVLRSVDYEVDSAANGREALGQIAVNRPDVILLDLMMPVMSGWQFLEARRTDPTLSAIPVVVMTAASSKITAGVDVQLRKPFDIDVLLATLAAVCHTDPPHGPTLTAA